MSQLFLKSEKVHVYPSAYRGFKTEGGESRVIDPASRLNLEENIIKTINGLASKDSFVIADNYAVDNTIECSIHGYWFKLDLSEAKSNFADKKYVYAKILLQPKNDSTPSITDYQAVSLSSLKVVGSGGGEIVSDQGYLDDATDFCGLEIIPSDTEVSVVEPYHILLILVEDGITYIVPDSSKFKLTSESIENLLGSGTSITELFTTNEVNAQTVSADEVTAETATVDEVTAETVTTDEVNANTVTANEANIEIVTAFDVSADGVSAQTVSTHTATITNGSTRHNIQVDSNGNLIITPPYNSGYGRIEISANGKVIKKFDSISAGNCVYKVDEYGNTGNYDFEIPTNVWDDSSGVDVDIRNSLVFKGAKFEKITHSDNTIEYAFDLATSGGKRLYATSSSGAANNWWKGLDYQKVNFAYDSTSGSLTITYES